MKKFCMSLAIILLTVTCGLSFGACGGGSSDEIIVWWPSGRALESVIDKAVDDFKVLHPEAKIKIANKSVDAFDAYKYALNDNKTRPDVAILDHVYVSALAHDNLLADLSAMGSDDIKSQYPSAIYEANCYNKKAYALPFSANTVVLMYNKDILKACNIVDGSGEAKAPTTFVELTAACQTIKDKGYTAFAQPQSSFSVMEFSSYVARNGGSLISADYLTATFTTDAVIAAISDWVEMSKFASQSTYEEDKFYNGKIAFVEMGSWALSKVSGSSKRFDCGFSEMVTIDASLPNTSGLGLYSLCVAEKSRDKELAYEFAKFLSTNIDVQLSYNKEQNLFPVTNEALEDSYYTDNAALSIYASQLQKVVSRPITPVWPELESAVQNMLVEIVRDSTNLKTIAQKYQNQVQSAIDRLFK